MAIGSQIHQCVEMALLADTFALKDFATAIAIFITSILAVVVTLIYNLNQLKIQSEAFAHEKNIKRKEALTQLRLKALDMHESFWNDKEMAEARRLVSNENEYEILAEILHRRTSTDQCDVSAEDYAKLEKIDRFYAALMRLCRIKETMAAFGGDQESEQMISASYGYWIEILLRPDDQVGNRHELKQYLVRYWPGIADSIPPGASYGARPSATV